jgi:predicted transcriptional regulator
MSITIEVSEETAAAIQATPEGLERVRELLEDACDTPLASLQRGFSDIAAGRTFSFEKSYARGREELLVKIRQAAGGK